MPSGEVFHKDHLGTTAFHPLYDLPRAVKQGKVKQFADDTTVYCASDRSRDHPPDSTRILQEWKVGSNGMISNSMKLRHCSF